MKKMFLMIFAGLALISFFFYTPIMVWCLGLCCVGLGLYSLIRPHRMAIKAIRRLAVIRVLGCLLIMIGGLCTYMGGKWIDLLYLSHALRPASPTVELNPPQMMGTDPLRPVNPSGFQQHHFPHVPHHLFTSRVHHEASSIHHTSTHHTSTHHPSTHHPSTHHPSTHHPSTHLASVKTY
jgi:hypothetical protein